VTRPPVARATPAEGAAPPRRHPHDHRPGPIEVQPEPFADRRTDRSQGPLRRWDGHHVAFGRGVHFCLDAALARMEARTVISTMLHRIPDWNTERIGGTAGAQDHSAARPPSPPREPRQHSRGMSINRLQRARACAGCRRHRLRGGLGRRGRRTRSHRSSPRRGYASADPRKHPFLSRYGRGSGDCGVGLQERPFSGRVRAVRAHRSPLRAVSCVV
jgi:hypothetical protein